MSAGDPPWALPQVYGPCPPPACWCPSTIWALPERTQVDDDLVRLLGEHTTHLVGVRLEHEWVGSVPRWR